MSKKTTDFGYQQVPVGEKSTKVARVFSSVAPKYDLMNDLMSFGLHRWWKHFTISISGVRPGDRVLDLAGGTGDLAKQFVKQVGESGEVTLADINEEMLSQARQRLVDAGILNQVNYVQANAEVLPFPDDYFDVITIGFGLRNVTNKDKALASMWRVMKPGGHCLVLEFSKPTLPGLSQVYDLYSFSILPKLGQWIANDSDSYQYLAESIRMHPDQQTLLTMMQAAGFENCQYHNLAGGIVAVHRGYKA